MRKIDTYLKLSEKQKTLTHLQNLLMILNWDNATKLPVKSAENRHKEITTLSMIHHQLLTSGEFASLIEETESSGNLLNDIEKRNLQLIKRNFRHNTLINKELQEKFTLLCSNTEFL